MLLHRYKTIALSVVMIWGTTISAGNQPLNVKPWNFMVYMSNNNNLHRYGILNLKQMMQVGSTNSMNLLLQMDELGESNISRYHIQQDKANLIQVQNGTPTSFSGTPENLYQFGSWVVNSYPAQKNCLVLWNHGAGIKDPSIWGRRLLYWRDDFYAINHKTGLLELDRGFLEKIKHKERGIAFNEAACAYLTNEDLKNSLEALCKDQLKGNKLDLLVMDACHMAMVEVASQVKNAVKIMVASEEVEPGSGYNYKSALSIFQNSNPEPTAAAQYFVRAYDQEYRSLLGDYTQSAVDLTNINALEQSISDLSNALIQLIDRGGQQANQVLRNLRLSPNLSTEFYDSDYIDLGHLFVSISQAASTYSKPGNWGYPVSLSNDPEQSIEALWKNIGSVADNGAAVLNSMVIDNATGRNLRSAKGLAIYFPIRSIHSSYAKTEFAKLTTWPKFLERYLKGRPWHKPDSRPPQVSKKKTAKNNALFIHKASSAKL